MLQENSQALSKSVKKNNNIKLNTVEIEGQGQLARGYSKSRKKLTGLSLQKNSIHKLVRVKTEISDPFSQLVQRNSTLKVRNLSSKQLAPLNQCIFGQYKDQTRLSLSSQSWLLYDYRIKAYKRGWKPSQVGQMSGMNRILLFKIFLQLQKQNEQINNFQAKINSQYLRQEIDLSKIRKLSPSKRPGFIKQDAIKRGMENSTVISIIDLMYGLIMTDFDDVLEYATVFLGYLCYCQMNKIQLETQHTPFHFIEKVNEAIAYREYLAQYINEIFFPSLQMHFSMFNPEKISLASTPNDICKLFHSIQNDDFFNQVVNCNEKICKIRFQVGYRVHEPRTLVWKNKRTNLGANYSFIGHWRGLKNFTSVIRNKGLEILIILRQCKFGMLERDIKTIEGWVKDMRKPIVEQRKIVSFGQRLQPIMKLSQIQLMESRIQFKRSNTQI